MLVVAARGSGPDLFETMQAAQERIRGSHLAVIENDGDRVVASDADQVVGLVRTFLLDDTRG